MVENSSGKEKKSKLTSLKIHCAKNFQPSGRDFYPADKEPMASGEKGCRHCFKNCEICSYAIIFGIFAINFTTTNICKQR